MKTSPRPTLLVLIAAFCASIAGGAAAGQGDALIQYNMGMAAREAGKTEEAYGLFKKSCMASDGLAEACLAWGEMAALADNEKDVKRALGSAVMMNPEDIRARFELAVSLIKKQDWVWAAEHLEEALPHAKTVEDRSLLRYYLGYTKFKNGEFEEAARHFALSSHSLPLDLAQKCNYYRGLIALELDKVGKAYDLLEQAQEGPNPRIKDAAVAKIKRQTTFPRIEGIGGQVIASFGLNTHPATSFLETSESRPVLQSVLRGDVMAGTKDYKHGLFAAFTVYREQNWAEIGGDDDSTSSKPGTITNNMSPGDMDVTLLMLQGAYIWRGFKGGVEQEIRIGIDGEMQFLDRLPNLEEVINEDYETHSEYNASDDKFELYTWALAIPKFWWSWSSQKDSIWSTRFKFEHRPNYIDTDRSTNRFRLRLVNTRWFLKRTLQMKVLLGGRYDRAYEDPRVIKYDRLLPELWFDAKWKTPVERLTLLGGFQLKYNWYLNSRFNQLNSFRPAYQNNPQFTDEVNDGFESDYYDYERHDFEWEIHAEAQLQTWHKASLSLRYFHHQRHSNMDSAPKPMMNPYGEGWDRISAPEYGYSQDVVVLELKQGF